MNKLLTKTLLVLLTATLCLSLAIVSGCSSTKSQRKDKNHETIGTFLSKDKPNY